MQLMTTGKSNDVAYQMLIFMVLMFLLTAIVFGNLEDKLSISETKTNNESSKLLQYTVNDHILGFAQDKVYLAGLDHALAIEFIDGNQAQPEEANETESSLEKVKYSGVWHGIDVIYTPIEGGIAESTYQLAPGANANDIILRYNLPAELLENGQLRFQFQNGYILENAPIAWQDFQGKRIEVDVHFKAISENEIGFSLGVYDPAHPLTIDPGYSWHSFYGGTNPDYSAGITVDANGDILITGRSNSSTWTLPGNPAPLNSHKGSFDIFVLKLDKSGAYQWHTFLGSIWDDSGIGITTDQNNNILIIGMSGAQWNGPENTSPLNNFTGTNNLVIAKLDNNGNYLWHTFYPGSSISNGLKGIATDEIGNIYVTSLSSSWNGPGNIAPLNPATPSDYGSEIVVIKLNINGAYQWHTYFGSLGDDHGNAITIDNAGNLFITGKSSSAWNGPGNVSPIHSYNGDAFSNTVIIKINDAGVYQWHTFFGTAGGDDFGNAIDIDSNGFIYTASRHDGTLTGPNGEPPLNNSLGWHYVIKLDSAGGYVWHSRTGGYSNFIHVTYDGSILISSNSYLNLNGPNGEQPLNPWAGYQEIMLLKINSNGVYKWHTYYGSNNSSDYVTGVTSDAIGNIYMATYSSETWDGPGNTTPLNPFTSAGPHISNPDIAIIKMTAQTPTDITLDNSTLNEDLPAGAIVGVLSNNGFDIGETVIYSFCGGIDDSYFSITNNLLKTATTLSFAIKSSYDICIRVTDPDGPAFDKTFTIQTNARPTSIILSNNTIPENQPAGVVIGLLTANDPNGGDTFSYSFCGGPDDTSFLIDGSNLGSGLIYDFESQSIYNVCIRATDPGLLFHDQNITINISNINDQPSTISLSNATINEGLPPGAIVGAFTTTDPDSNEPFNYILVSGAGDTDNNAFVLNGNQLLSKYPFNFLTKRSYSIRVQTMDDGGLSFEKTFTIHVNDLPPVFSDVPDTHWAVAWIERLYNSGITGGCANNPLAYCPESTVTRAQMAVFLEKGMHVSSFTPANVSPTFTDTENHWAEDWIEALKIDGVTSGCGEGIFCPENSVTRAQMAVFLLKAKHGASFTPQPAAGMFSDVSADYWAATWIEQLAIEGITSGCGGSNYCPENPVTRVQMAVFLVNAFNLP